ncbi:MAG: hypothetical protein GY832_18680 [Chloroflexi bacterium]|nr:hypothetical protein [Chloroflexota bacterium]
MNYGYQCGMLWGATLAAGAQAYRLFGAGPQAETAAIIAAQRLVESFRTRNNHINCLEVTGFDLSSPTPKMIMHFFMKGGPIGCIRMAAKYPPVAFSEIHTALSEKHIKAPAPPASCAALLAQKMGVSDMHITMAAGFAGGIGLSGGACGALGAAIWVIGMNSLKEGVDQFGFKNPRALEVINRFMKCTNNTFECSEIVGQKFKNIDDHAGYLRDGGCSKIIKVLAM